MAKRKMFAQIKYRYESGDVTAEMDLSRFEKQFSKAQYGLDSSIMNSMVPFMPMQTSTFINVVRGMSAVFAGSGKVVAATPPHGRFLYEGETMVDVNTGSPWARKSAEKVPVSQYQGKTNAKEKLTYSKAGNPKAQAHWFDAAKEKDGEQWVKKVKKTAGGG